jgi:hypothetical protein
LPEIEFRLFIARLETVMRRHGFAADAVLWQIVSFVGEAVACCTAPRPSATATELAKAMGTASVARKSRFIVVPP